MGAIKKRGDKRYTRTITIGRQTDGKPIRKFVYGKTIKEVEAKAAQAKIDLKNGTLSVNDKAKFIDIAHEWVDLMHPDVQPHTRKWYHSMIDRHLAPLHQVELKKLKPRDLQTILKNVYDKGLSDKMLQDVKIIAAAILNYAIENDLLFRNVFSHVSVPKRGKAKRQPITEEQRELILRTWEGHRMGVPVLVMLFCGLRKGEMVALTWNDVDLERQTISVTKSAVFNGNRSEIKCPKTEAGNRLVPLPDMLVPILRDAKKKGSLYVCPSADGQRMTETAWNTSWNSYLHYLNIQAGGRDASRSRPKLVVVDRFTAHQLRHTYATMLYDAGVDVKSAQDMLGHADASVTMGIYTHLSAQKKAKAVAALNQHITENVTPIVMNVQ